jgi:dTDP-4-amino-4,6-dideoxygalactose transaminase
MSDVQAAMMRVQLRRLPDLVKARSSAAEGYAERLASLEGIQLPVVLDDRTHPWQSYLITTDETVDRDAVVVALRDRGVGSNFGTYASHVQPVYDSRTECPVSARLFATQFALPMHANLTEDDLDYVAEQLREVLADAAVRR